MYLYSRKCIAAAKLSNLFIYIQNSFKNVDHIHQNARHLKFTEQLRGYEPRDLGESIL